MARNPWSRNDLVRFQRDDDDFSDVLPPQRALPTWRGLDARYRDSPIIDLSERDYDIISSEAVSEFKSENLSGSFSAAKPIVNGFSESSPPLDADRRNGANARGPILGTKSAEGSKRPTRKKPDIVGLASDGRPVFASWTRAKGFNPTGPSSWPSTLYGAAARTGAGYKAQFNTQMRQEFNHPSLTIPCIERMVRREVFFAKRLAGRGYRKPKRRTWLSMIGC